MGFFRRTYNALLDEISGVLSLGPQSRLAFINVAGLAALVAFTALVYLRTQEPIILLIGGLICTVSVIGATMSKTA